MGKIKTLTPVHIGSGESYLSLFVHKQFKYDDLIVLNTVDRPENLINTELLKKLSNPSTFKDSITGNRRKVSNRELANQMGINYNKLDNRKADYPVDYYESHENKQGYVAFPQKNVFESIKSNNMMIIPGSTIKGYILNVLWADIVATNARIKNYILNEFRNKRNYRLFHENHFKDYNRLIRCRDVIFKGSVVSIYEAKRLNTKGSEIPIGMYECLDEEVEVKDVEFIFDVLPNEVEEIRGYVDLSDKDNIFHQMNDEILKRIFNLKSWFPQANKEFLLRNLKKEEKFIRQSLKREKAELILEDYKRIKSSLNQGDVVMRLGKHGGFFNKTFVSAFGDENFKVFNIRAKKSEDVRSMSLLLDSYGEASIPLGFVKFEL